MTGFIDLLFFVSDNPWAIYVPLIPKPLSVIVIVIVMKSLYFR